MSNTKRQYCQHCDQFIDSDELVERHDSEPYEFWGQRGVQHIVYYICPDCGEELCDSLVVCEQCEEARPADGSDLCNACEEASDHVDG